MDGRMDGRTLAPDEVRGRGARQLKNYALIRRCCDGGSAPLRSASKRWLPEMKTREKGLAPRGRVISRTPMIARERV